MNLGVFRASDEGIPSKVRVILFVATDPLCRPDNDRSVPHLEAELVGQATLLSPDKAERHNAVGHQQSHLADIVPGSARGFVLDAVGVDRVVPNFGSRVHIQNQRHTFLADMQFQQAPERVGREVLSIFRTLTVAEAIAPSVRHVLSMSGDQQRLLSIDYFIIEL